VWFQWRTVGEGGGAVFYVVEITAEPCGSECSTLHHNLSSEFQNAPGICDHTTAANTRSIVALDI
jgi:hypothetical protein